jgi:hypothetical protein
MENLFGPQTPINSTWVMVLIQEVFILQERDLKALLDLAALWLDLLDHLAHKAFLVVLEQ